MSPVRVRARITGRVQGVWYRGSTCERAEQLGVVGWVRNVRDGSVELEAEGPEAAVQALVDWCHRGPPGARVTGVEVEPVAVAGSETSFQVRY